MARITDYGWMLWCPTCDHGFLNSEWNHDADMCRDCASITEEVSND